MLKSPEFETHIEEFYKENDIYIDTSRLNVINANYKYAVPSMAYMFSPGIGRYKDRTLLLVGKASFRQIFIMI